MCPPDRVPQAHGQTLLSTLDQTRFLTRRDLQHQPIPGATCPLLPPPGENEMGKCVGSNALLDGVGGFLQRQKGNTKDKNGRRLLLWWDAGTVADLKLGRRYGAVNSAREGRRFGSRRPQDCETIPI